jgi:transposase
MQAVLKAQINKTDRNDARGITQMMRVGLYRPVHVKTLRSQKLRMLLTHRKLLVSKAIAIENDLRGTLRNFDLKVGIAGKVKFEARIKQPTFASAVISVAKGAMCGRLRVGKQNLHVARLVGAAMCSGFEYGHSQRSKTR